MRRDVRARPGRGCSPDQRVGRRARRTDGSTARRSGCGRRLRGGARCRSNVGEQPVARLAQPHGAMQPPRGSAGRRRPEARSDRRGKVELEELQLHPRRAIDQLQRPQPGKRRGAADQRKQHDPLAAAPRPRRNVTRMTGRTGRNSSGRLLLERQSRRRDEHSNSSAILRRPLRGEAVVSCAEIAAHYQQRERRERDIAQRMAGK